MTAKTIKVVITTLTEMREKEEFEISSYTEERAKESYKKRVKKKRFLK